MKVLAAFAHPDDESLGCGGTLAKYAEQGHEVRILIATSGRADNHDNAKALHRAANILGASAVTLHWPDQALDSVMLIHINRSVERLVESFKPEIVFTHHQDLNRDHQIVREAVLVATRPQSGVKRVLACEIPSSTEVMGGFDPNVFEVLTERHLYLKCKALQEYGPEARPFPHGRSTEALSSLAMWRGVACGEGLAEAFTLVREIR